MTDVERRSIYKEQRSWSDKYLPQVKQILLSNARSLLNMREGTFREDTRESTDLKVLVVDGGTIAVRLRKPSCSFRDLTIRAMHPRADTTEIHKIREGFGRWYFYGWVDDNNIIAEWILVDLDLFRDSGMAAEEREYIINPDGTEFHSYSIAEVLPLIVASELSADTRLKSLSKVGAA